MTIGRSPSYRRSDHVSVGQRLEWLSSQMIHHKPDPNIRNKRWEGKATQAARMTVPIGKDPSVRQ